MSIPSPSPVTDLLDAFRRTKVMFAAVALGVFDALGGGPLNAPALAERLDANPDGLERLLDACVGLEFLKKENSIYSNLPVAEAYLRRGSPQTLTGYILYSNYALYGLWGRLEDAVHEGSHRWTQVFRVEGPIFDHFFRTEENKREFLRGMHGFGLMSSPPVVAAFDLSRFRRLVDLGGATGHLASAACELYPQMQAAIFDLSPAIEFTREFMAGSPLLGRLELIPGDFFRDPLPEGDLYALGRILHDWSEEKICKLLAKIYAKLPSGGGLLIAEKLLNEQKTGPLPALLQSLNMLVCTEGKERTLEEYAALLRAAGFAEVEGRMTGAAVDAVLALKA
ncbi:MAG TPA: class I SAM-dependent methyltransferase [Terriglobia bacterium]|nr:class I SAM-dependent methyltransferase [Terriglobia bacterium]